MNFDNCFTYSFIFHDGNTNSVKGNPVAPFTPVSLGNTTNVASAIAAGFRTSGGGLVVPASVDTNNIGSSPIIGITTGASNPLTGEVTVAIAGVAEVWANAAIVAGALLEVVSATTRTNVQTPFTSLEEALIPTDPSVTRTYNICLVDDTTITPATSGANALHYPVGVALKAAAAQYDVIPVLLQTQRFYA